MWPTTQGPPQGLSVLAGGVAALVDGDGQGMIMCDLRRQVARAIAFIRQARIRRVEGEVLLR